MSKSKQSIYCNTNRTIKFAIKIADNKAPQARCAPRRLGARGTTFVTLGNP
jgi:hypothetical protein